MLPDAVQQFWPILADALAAPALSDLRARVEQAATCSDEQWSFDWRTRESFSLEWAHYAPGDRTWGMNLDDRVRWFFVEPLRIPLEDLPGKVVLDAGCGNGSQSVAYTELGLEVIAVDLSSGLEHGQVFRNDRPRAVPENVHFVQADLQSPPLAPSAFDIIHSAGVLQATPSTESTFRALAPLCRPGGRFYVWVLKYEPIVTPVVNSLRAVTTRMTPPRFARVAWAAAPAFQLLSRALNALGVRAYARFSRREAALALMDIFGTPYAHDHSFEEVASWFECEGFGEVWRCNDYRRGFGACAIKRDSGMERP